MKKEIVLPALALGLGAAGFCLRRWELGAALDASTGLMRTDCPATWLLLGLTAVAATASATLCLGAGERKLTPRERFCAPETGYILLVVCAAMLLMAGAGAGFASYFRTSPDNPLWLVIYGLCILSGLCFLGLGRTAYRMEWEENSPLLTFGPPLWALVCLVGVYQNCSRQPVLLLYLYPLMAVVCTVLALYCAASLAMGRGVPWAACVFSLLGVYLSLVSLADGLGLALSLMHLSGALYLTAQLYMLLRGAFGAPWPKRLLPGRMPSGAQEDGQEDQPEKPDQTA